MSPLMAYSVKSGRIEHMLWRYNIPSLWIIPIQKKALRTNQIANSNPNPNGGKDEGSARPAAIFKKPSVTYNISTNTPSDVAGIASGDK
jgi:hypothetical protein